MKLTVLMLLLEILVLIKRMTVIEIARVIGLEWPARPNSPKAPFDLLNIDGAQLAMGSSAQVF